MSHRFKLCKPKVIITAPAHLANVQAACKDSGDLNAKIFVLDAAAEAALVASEPVCNGDHGPLTADTAEPPVPKPAGPITNGYHEPQTADGETPSVAALLTHGTSDWFRISDLDTAKSTIACMFSTSGTTGLPKVSQLSHHALVAQHLSVQSPSKRYPVRRLISLPFFNMFASGIVHVEPLLTGEPMYVLSRFDLQAYVSGIHKYQITDTATAPLMLIYMLKSGLPLKEKLGSLRYIWNGSAPVDKETLKAFYNVLPDEAMIAGIWGMSETGAQTAFKWFEKDDSGSVGRIIPGVEMK